ncbi:MAG TPA: ATP synthase F0 subunit B [Vicinamibacterales bacterium]|jgi:F-type H+-transporting ATPase subunit b|nr:ATP synthase F0 subunit B [Vicinamibacterales bacterium]
MRFDCNSQALLPRARARRVRALLLAVFVAAAVSSWRPTVYATGASWQHPEQAHTEKAAEGQHGEAEAEGGWLQVIAKIFNFALLAGILAYYLKTPIQTHLASRGTQIRQDLVSAAELRATAEAQLAEIESKLKTLPAELEALRLQGGEDVRAERARIEQAASTERQRLLDQTRRDIDMRLRIARRQLLELAAQLSVDVAKTRIARTITPEDQLRLVDRYATQLREAGR